MRRERRAEAIPAAGTPHGYGPGSALLAAGRSALTDCVTYSNEGIGTGSVWGKEQPFPP